MATLTFLDESSVEIPALKVKKTSNERNAETMEKALTLCRAKREIKMAECHELRSIIVDCENRNKKFTVQYKTAKRRFDKVKNEIERIDRDIQVYAVTLFAE